MAALNFPLSTVLNISISGTQAAQSTLNTSNIAIFTRETNNPSFGTAAYKIYTSPTQVGLDFGTSSNTYAMALAAYSQKPNFSGAGGYLVVIPFLTAAQDQIVSLTFPGVPATGTFELTYNSNSTSALTASTLTAAAFQTATRLVTGLTSATITGSNAAGYTIDAGVTGIGHPFTISANSIADANSVTVTPVITVTQPGSTAETIDQAIIRTQNAIPYFGVLSAEIPSQIVMLAGAALIQTLNKIAFWPSFTAADLNVGGMLDLLRSGTLQQSRGLYYGDVLATALGYAGAYAGRGMSTNFTGSNTTSTMQLKALSTIQPDPSLTASQLVLALAAGVDVYANLGTNPVCITSGNNDFFDNQYNLQWLANQLQVNGINALAQTGTKIPQTEGGMNALKAAYRSGLEQAVTNGFLAPGTWNSATTFGPGTDLADNVANRGYYVYSSPVSAQSAATRQTRAAPLVQLAAKFAGGIHSSSSIINVNP